MKFIKVAAAALNQTPRDWRGNVANIRTAIEEARKENVTILCLPEACITGYGLEDDLFCADVPHRAMLRLKEIIHYTKGMIVCVGLPIRFDNTLYNAVATIVDGAVVGFTCKQHLAGDGIHYENRWFKPWPSGVVQSIYITELEDEDFKLTPNIKKFLEIGLGRYPIGDTHFNIGGVKIGYEICEDAWVANRPGTILSTKGIDIYLNPSASHFAFGKQEVRKNFVVDGSRAFNATYIYANLLGNEAGRAIYDGATLIASGGNLLALGKRFSYKNIVLTTAIIDVDNTKTQQVRTASFQPNVEKYNDGCINSCFKYPEVREKTAPISLDTWELSKDIKHEECTRALGLALMDYMRKSHTKGFAVSLSGGADSAMVTYLCAMGIRLAVSELGVFRFINKYCPHLGTGARCSDFDRWHPEDQVKRLISLLITTAYQATAQSGETTRLAAKILSNELGVTHHNFILNRIVEQYMTIGSLVKGEPLTFRDDGIVLQNLQARVRAPSIWIIANMQNKLLLTTSNMSEAAVGYATMDGDTAGCVSPIAGLPKVYIREYLKWVEEVGPANLNSLSVMSCINSQQPTAELLPKQLNQTDEKDLMPYWLLHMIESLVVKNRYIPVEVYQYLKTQIEYDNNQLIKDITKFFKLFAMNQWKRERYALSFHMDDHNLDPRTWCRMPILSGGYEEELEELKKYIVKEGVEVGSFGSSLTKI